MSYAAPPSRNELPPPPPGDVSPEAMLEAESMKREVDEALGLFGKNELSDGELREEQIMRALTAAALVIQAKRGNEKFWRFLTVLALVMGVISMIQLTRVTMGLLELTRLVAKIAHAVWG